MAGRDCLSGSLNSVSVCKLKAGVFLFFIYDNGVDYYKSLRGNAATLYLLKVI